MDIAEVKKEKRMLEQNIERLAMEFEAKTNETIQTISIRDLYEWLPRRKYKTPVRVYVSIDE